LLDCRKPETLRTRCFGRLGTGNPGSRLCFLRRRLPYEGAIAPQGGQRGQTLFDMGCYEVSLGDTIGVGTPASISA
jgi:hypothetical protein